MADTVSKRVSITMGVEGYDAAKLRIDELTAKADELGRLHPEIVPEIEKEKALLQARLLKAGIQRELSNIGGGGPGILGTLFGKGGGGFGALGSSSGIVGIAAAGTAAASALLVEIAGLAAGFAAATAGIGAFAALAIPTFDKIKNAYTGISAAQKAYNQAAAIQAEDPTKTHANAAAAALLKLKVAQESMGPSTRTAVSGIQSLINTYEKMAKAFAPAVLKVFNDSLKIANTLLPTLKPFADAAGTAIDGLLKKAEKFFQSADFKKWLDQFVKLVGPSITAIGTGLGKASVAFGKLLTVMSAHDVVHAINILFDTITVTLNVLDWTIARMMNHWDRYVGQFQDAWRNMRIWAAEGAIAIIGAVKYLVDRVLHFFQNIIDGAAHAFGWIPGIGGKLKTAAAWFDSWHKSVDDSLTGAQKSLQNWVTALQNAPKIVKLKADITDLTAKAATARQILADKRLNPDIRAHIRADVSQLLSQAAAARAALASIQGKTVYVTSVINSVPGPVRGHAAGGWAAGWTLAGEQGPELLYTPGSQVYPAQQTKTMLTGQSGGAHYTININTLVADRNTGARVVEAIRQFEAGSGHGWRK